MIAFNESIIPTNVAVSVSLALFAALAFEFVNGFHDTANAVATVIYTRSLKPTAAVLYSGIMNFLGVIVAGVGVAYSVVNLFPLEALMTGQGNDIAMAMIFSVLLSAITWNLATWYLGIPASSSQAMIGAIVGASMGYSLHMGIPLDQGVPWDKVRSVMAALFLSPLLGFACAAVLLKVGRWFIKDERLYGEPEGDPPRWVRGLLITTCGGVSFAHGSNDGQKGMGLMMLTLMCLLPASFSLNLATSREDARVVSRRCATVARLLSPESSAGYDFNSKETLEQFVLDGKDPKAIAPVLASALRDTSRKLDRPLTDIAVEERAAFRNEILVETRALRRFNSQRPEFVECADSLAAFVEYVSMWVKVAVALALGLGTMVGWKRIVTTVGEKIGKSHLSYAQGAAAEVVAATTILLADGMKLPVSTTHVLSSGVAGAMYAEKSGLQTSTIRNIVLAWVLTLPVCITLGMGIFFLLLARGT